MSVTQVAAITGATGFLGRAIAATLRRDGWRIRALVRPGADDAHLSSDSCEIVSGDLADWRALETLVSGADAIVHAAGLVRTNSTREFTLVNAEGSAALGRAASSIAPEARFVLVSSFAAREPHLSPYAASKRQGEDRLRDALGDRNWVVVRPPAIYGPWDRETLLLFRLASGPVIPIYSAAGARACLIHVSDAAEAVARLCAGGPSRKVLEISDARMDGYSWREIATEAARATGGRPLILGLPSALLRLAGLVGDSLARGGKRVSTLGSDKVREILHGDWSSAPASQPDPTLWRPSIGLPQGMAATVAWYREAGWLS